MRPRPQLYYRYACKGLAGPTMVVPIIGGIVEMVRDPYGYWQKALQREKNGISKFTLVGKLVLFSTNTDVSRKILTYNGPDALEMVRAVPVGQGIPSELTSLSTLESAKKSPRRAVSSSQQPFSSNCQAVHPSGKWILGPKNLAFMHGPAHKALRKSFLSLFTPKALSTYVCIQVGPRSQRPTGLERGISTPIPASCLLGVRHMGRRRRHVALTARLWLLLPPDQDDVVKKHVEMWLDEPEVTKDFSEMRERIRIMNQETSQMARAVPTPLQILYT